MDEIIRDYYKLLELIEDEKIKICNSIQGGLCNNYDEILFQEYKKIENQIENLKL